MFFSSIALSSSSGVTSIKIPKSLKYKFLISFKTETLYFPIWFINSSLKSAYSKTSAILEDNAVAKF